MLQVTDMIEVWNMRELLAEIMRQRVDMNPYETGEFRGPFPSGAPGTFIEVFANKSTEITFFTYLEDGSRRFIFHWDGRSVEQLLGPVLRNCSTPFLGENELLVLSGQVNVQSAISKLFDTYPLRLIVLKRGSRGCTVYSPEYGEEIPACRIEEVNPASAGACYDAGFLCGSLDGGSIVDSTRMAAEAGELNTQVFGAMEGKITKESITAVPRDGMPL